MPGAPRGAGPAVPPPHGPASRAGGALPPVERPEPPAIAPRAPASPAAAAAQLAGSQGAAPQAVPRTAPADQAASPPDAQLAAVAARLQAAPAGGHLTIRLAPAELGQVQIRLTRTAGGGASIVVGVERPETLAAFQSGMAQLHQALDSAGVPQLRSVALHLAASDATGSSLPASAGSQGSQTHAATGHGSFGQEAAGQGGGSQGTGSQGGNQGGSQGGGQGRNESGAGRDRAAHGLQIAGGASREPAAPPTAGPPHPPGPHNAGLNITA